MINIAHNNKTKYRQITRDNAAWSVTENRRRS